jgi:hypothetical protein
MALVNTEETALLDFYNGKTSHGLSVPTTAWYGLHLGATPPNKDTGTGVNEPTEANYARIQQTLSTFWAPATGGDPTDSQSNINMQWAVTAAAYSDDIYYILEFATETANTFRRSFKLATPATIGSGDRAFISAGNLVAEFGDDGDTFGETS